MIVGNGFSCVGIELHEYAIEGIGVWEWMIWDGVVSLVWGGLVL